MIIKLINDTSSLNRPSHTRHCPLNDSTLCIVQLLKLNLWMKNLRSDQLIQLKPQTLLENIFHSPVVSISCCEIIDRLWALRKYGMSQHQGFQTRSIWMRWEDVWLNFDWSLLGAYGWSLLRSYVTEINLNLLGSYKVWKKLFSAWKNLEKSIEIFRKKISQNPLETLIISKLIEWTNEWMYEIIFFFTNSPRWPPFQLKLKATIIAWFDLSPPSLALY